MTKADIEQMTGHIGGMMQKMEEHLKSLPPEQQKQIRQMMAGKMGAGAAGTTLQTTYKKVGSANKVNEWTCDRYEGYRGPEKVSEICAASWRELGLTPADFAVLEQLAQLFKGLASALSKDPDEMTYIGGPAGYDGVPVYRVLFTGGQPRAKYEVTEVRRENFADTLFQVPADYKKVAMPTMPKM
jgi:hypothetical protein